MLIRVESSLFDSILVGIRKKSSYILVEVSFNKHKINAKDSRTIDHSARNRISYQARVYVHACIIMQKSLRATSSNFSM